MNDHDSSALDGEHLPEAEQHLDARDRVILASLATAYDHLDPPPEDLAARATFAVAMTELEAEVAALVQADDHDRELAGVRSADASAARSITFASDDHTLTLQVGRRGRGRRRVDGWIAGDATRAASVGLRLVDTTIEVDVSSDGRFVVEDLAEGLAQLSVRAADGSALLVTPSFQL